MNFDAPESARNNARKVLAWRKKYGSEVKGMTGVGWGRARQLASGQKLSRETVAAMAKFNRFRKKSTVSPEYKSEPWRDAGYVAWLGWGGDSGINWAMGIMDRERKGVKAAMIEIQAESASITAAVEAGAQPKFDVVAYNGGPLKVGGYDLPIVIDLAGLDVGKSVIANLHHKKDQLVGHVDNIENDGKGLKLKGLVSAVTEHAKQFVESAANGFPWSASIEASPSKVDEIPEGSSVVVNGRSISGPVYVARKSRLYGVAFLPHGADENTVVNVAASAVDPLHTRSADMPFNQWVEAMGFDPESLTEVQRQRLHEKFSAEIEASDATTKVEAGAFDLDDIKAAASEHNAELEAAFAEYEGEVPAKKMAEIKAGAIKASRELKTKALKERWNTAKFEIEAVKAVASTKLDLVRAGASHEGPAIHMSRKDESPEVVEAALATQLRLPNIEKHYKDQVLEAAHKQYRNIGLQQILLMAAASNGMPVHAGQRIHAGNLRETLRYALPDVHGSGFSTLGVSVSNILSNVANKELVAGYEEGDNSWREISAIKSVNDFKSVTTYRLLDDMQYEEVGPGGEIKHGSVSQESYSRQVKTYARMFSLTRQDIINDDLGAFDDLRTRLGAGAAMRMRDLFWATFMDNASFFTSARGNYITGSTTTLLTDGVGLSLGVKAFRNLKSPTADGAKVIGGSPSILLVPPDLEVAAETLYTATNLVGGSSTVANANIHAGKYRVVVASQLADSAFTGNSTTAWYLLREPSLYPSIVVSFLNGQQSPTVENADADFDTLGIQFRGYHDFGVDKAEYLAGIKSKGAA